MATFGEGQVAQVGEIRLEGRGVTGEASAGIATSRDARSSVIEDAIPRDGFADRAQFTFEVTGVSSTSRDAQSGPARDYEPPAVLVHQAPHAPGELGQVALVDDGGFIYIVRPTSSDSGEARFEIPVGDLQVGERGVTQFAGRVAVRIVGLFAKKGVEKTTELAIRLFERHRRDYRIRSFTDRDHRGDPEQTGPELLAGGPALLLVHGVNSTSRNAFRFNSEYVRKLGERYGGRVAAFDHPSLSFDPRANAEWLANELDGVDLREVDILAHSRGGLVARELLAQLGSESTKIRSVVFAATPNNGTPLADPDHIDAFLSMAINVTALIPDNPVTDAIGIALEVIREYLENVVEAISGVECMRPGSDVLRSLSTQGAGDTTFRAIAAHYEPRSDDGKLRRAADFVMDKAFRGEANDLLVPTRSTYLPADRFHVPVDQRLVLDSSFGVSHCVFWPEDRVLRQLDQWLDPNTSIDAAKPVASELTDPTAELEEATRIGSTDLVRRTQVQLRADMLKSAADQLGGSFELAANRSRDTTKKGSATRGTVIILPGILGSRLRVADARALQDEAGELVWLNKWALLRGRFRRLTVGDPRYRVRPDGLMKEYAALFAHLSATWNVHTFAYDWRLSIEQLCDDLHDFLTQREIDLADPDQPVHLIGHSMGGLIARAYVGRKNRSAWAQGSGRLVQLGTPNWGSFAMVAAALGDETAVRTLAAVDVFGSKEEILRVFRSFPSIYELFPSPLRELVEGEDPPHAALFDDPKWYGQPGDSREKSSIRPDLLEAARAFHTEMKQVHGDDRFVFVAGDAQPTPYRARVEASGKVSFGVTRSGDGRVPHRFGFDGLNIDDDRIFFVETSHGALASDERVLEALDDLLERGRTTVLASEPAGGVRAVLEQDDTHWVDADDLEQALGLPLPSLTRSDRATLREVDTALDLTTALYLGGGKKRPMAKALGVRVVHGSMEQAKHAVAAGRYKGIPIEGALKYLNDRLDGAVRDIQDLDLLPEDTGSAYFVPPRDDGTYPKGAIVVGLGEFGQLTSTGLARAMERGTIEYALASRKPGGRAPSVGVSTVLIGTPGRYGLSVQASILAMVQGVARAAARLKDMVHITELEIIELYEGKAEEAAVTLAKLHRTDRFAGMEVPIVPALRLDVRPGGRPGSGGYEQTGAPWLRVMLELDKQAHPAAVDAQRATDVDPTASASAPAVATASVPTAEPPRSQRLTWVSLGRSSQADHLAVDIPVSEIRRHVRAAIQHRGDSSDTNLTLFEMLFPHDAKLDLDEKDNLHLLVDSSTAWIPWEVVTGRGTDGKLLSPLALRAGVLRQLKPRDAESPRRSFPPIGRKALVIGDPPTSLTRLPGARAEARAVADLLERYGYVVTRCIYDDDDVLSDDLVAQIRNAFFAEHYRIIHIAGHGVYAEGSEDPFADGVVIGDLGKSELLTAQHFRQRLVRPDLVFLNCCHIGRIDDTASEDTRQTAYSDLAASMSIELMRTGVRAVVAAGWAVDDASAATFARSFYSSMIEGYAYGESVNQARKDCHDPRNNTWGAYQCYGDPDFQFHGAPRKSTDESEVVLSTAHFVKRIQVLEKNAGDQYGKTNCANVARELRKLERQYTGEFGTAVVWEALGSAYAEAGAFDDAVDCYRKAEANGSTNARAMDQLVNLQVRLAAMIHRGETFENPRVTQTARQLCTAAEGLLNRLFKLARTDEREVIKGSLYKRWASIDGGRRSKISDLRTSRDAYAEAARLASRNSSELSVYQACLAVQMAYITRADPEAGPEDDVDWVADYLARLTAQRDAMDPQSVEGDYYSRARPIDITATEIIASGNLADPKCIDEIVSGFTSAFRIRSTAKQRLSVEHHYRELEALLPSQEEKHAASVIANALGDA